MCMCVCVCGCVGGCVCVVGLTNWMRKRQFFLHFNNTLYKSMLAGVD